ncbi:MAG: hypothetical protein HYV54_00425 [Parcubacteria group bacterium]|nr:hypothetical protein [Parcubacteria group bacterium]
MTKEMQELALILAQCADMARAAWTAQTLKASQNLDTRPSETMDFFSNLDEELDTRLMEALQSRLGVKHFLTEEGAKIPERNSIGGRRAIIDSLDGSSNFITYRPDFGISVSLEQDGFPLIGGIVTPVRGELVIAGSGHGAYLFSCYGQELRAVERMIISDIARSVNTATFALKNVRKRKSPLETSRIYVHTGKRRNFELSPSSPWNTIYAKLANPACSFSCTVALLEVAMGKLDGAAIAFQNYWDFAAGRLIITEAGGHFAAFDRDFQHQLGDKEFTLAHAGKNRTGDEWLCHIFAASSQKLLEEMKNHFIS